MCQRNISMGKWTTINTHREQQQHQNKTKPNHMTNSSAFTKYVFTTITIPFFLEKLLLLLHSSKIAVYLATRPNDIYLFRADFVATAISFIGRLSTCIWQCFFFMVCLWVNDGWPFCLGEYESERFRAIRCLIVQRFMECVGSGIIFVYGKLKFNTIWFMYKKKCYKKVE